MKTLYTLTLGLLLLSLNIAYSQCFSEQTFDTAGESNYTIPGAAGEEFLIEIEAIGADGGAFMWGGNPPSEGGEGASMKASFMVNGGDDLFIIVGQKGSNGIGSPAGGGGGGGTAVILNSTDVLIAAGAGGGGGQGAANVGEGAGANTDSPAEGGAGPGTSGGGGFNEDGEDGVAGSGGGAGTLTAQGAGGNAGVVAGPGGTGFGGGGGGSGTVGGGGGGYQGGDGASGAGGDLAGKGGDSFVNTGFSSTVIFNNAGGNGTGTNSDGMVIITCIPLNPIDLQVVSQMNPLCFGDNNGQIIVAGSGGIDPYTYTINGGSSNNDGIFDNLTAGTYTIEVVDGNGSSSSIEVTLTEPDELILDLLLVSDNICPDGAEGAIEVLASGGTTSGTYTYTLNGANSQTSGLFFGLPVGSYTIQVIDDNGCTASLSEEISSTSQIVLSILEVNNASCFGAADGSVVILGEGGNGAFTFSLDGGDFQDETTELLHRKVVSLPD